jgi:hypothetical protein
LIYEKIIEESKQGQALVKRIKPQNTKKLFIESRLCYEFSDSEIVASILSVNGTILLKYLKKLI